MPQIEPTAVMQLKTIEQAELEAIQAALDVYPVLEAAVILGIGKTTLYRKLREYGPRLKRTYVFPKTGQDMATNPAQVDSLEL